MGSCQCGAIWCAQFKRHNVKTASTDKKDVVELQNITTQSDGCGNDDEASNFAGETNVSTADTRATNHPANLPRFGSKEQAIVVEEPGDAKRTTVVNAFKHMAQQICELPSSFWLVYGAMVLMEGKWRRSLWNTRAPLK